MSKTTRQTIAEAVERHGAAAVGRATGIPRSTILSIVAGGAREGTMLLADQRVWRLADLDHPDTEVARAV